MDTLELEMHCNGEHVASVSGPKDRAIAEMRHYATQYQDDSPLQIFRVERHPFNLERGE